MLQVLGFSDVIKSYVMLPSLRASLARLLATPCFFRGLVALYPFLCSPFSLACTFSLPPPCPGVCLCLFPCRLVFLSHLAL